MRHSRDVLRSIVLNKTIKVIEFTQTGRYKEKVPESYRLVLDACPLKVIDLDVKGKFMWWQLDGDVVPWYMWITYGMSGQFSTKKTNHTSMIVHHQDGELFFNDPRHFGTVKFVNNKKDHDKKLKSLGPDLLGDPLVTPELFAQNVLKKPNRTICEALMDQSCVSGVGNYVKSEALYKAGIVPHRNVTDLTSEEFIILHSATVSVLKDAYKARGASIRTYKSVLDEDGEAQFTFKVYSQKTCANGHPTSNKVTEDARRSWWCTQCQL